MTGTVEFRDRHFPSEPPPIPTPTKIATPPLLHPRQVRCFDASLVRRGSSMRATVGAATAAFPLARRASVGPWNRHEYTEHNVHIMECKLAACNLLSTVLDRLAEARLDDVVGVIADRSSGPGGTGECVCVCVYEGWSPS